MAQTDRQVVILPWTPGTNWKELSLMPSAIEQGMCGGWGYYSWEMSHEMDVRKDDLFFIVASNTQAPSSPAYDWLESMGASVQSFSGICFLGTIRDVFVNDEGNQEIELNILFGVLPGVIKTIDLGKLKKAIPYVKWDGREETILSNQDGDTLISLVRDWLKKEKRVLEGSSFTNIINRKIDDVIKEAFPQVNQ